MTKKEHDNTNDIDDVNNKMQTLNITNEISKYESSPIKKWIKLINIDKTILLCEYNRKDKFIKIANVVLDNEVFTSGKKQGIKKRNTLIKFNPIIPPYDFTKKTEWLYLLIINDRIVKIGGTRVGIRDRTGSYLCGHHILERGKSGSCSNTNGFIYNTLHFYLNLGHKIQMYGYELPKTTINIKICEIETEIKTQTYHAYESIFLKDYKKTYNGYPIFNDNCDPNY